MSRNKKPHDGEYYYVAPWKTRKAPTHSNTETPWCKKTPIPYTKQDTLSNGPTKHLFKDGKAIFPKIRCPDCGRILQLMTVDIENGYGDFWPYIPPHKRKELETIKSHAHKRRSKKRQRNMNIRGK